MDMKEWLKEMDGAIEDWSGVDWTMTDWFDGETREARRLAQVKRDKAWKSPMRVRRRR